MRQSSLQPIGSPMASLDFRTEMTFAYGEPRELAPGVVRLVANNPGPYTFKGTNSYVIGTETLAVIDPGPDDAAHFEALIKTIAGRPVSHVFITHTHRDHVDLLPRFLDATGAKTCGFGRVRIERPRELAGPLGDELIDFGFDPDITLATPGASVTGDGWALSAVPTPGHAPDHLCFELAGTGILFSGDHVMEWNTSVVAPPEGHMGDYFRSLEALVPRTDTVFLPGHGGRLENPQRMVRAYLVHRRWREQAILDAIRNGTATISAIVDLVYRGLDPRLVRAAGLSVQAHVEHLISQGLVQADGPVSLDRPLVAVAAAPPERGA
jgi:glyoxylase-like metal-dependent hydrolase (beta-lactamase superfamily II)